LQFSILRLSENIQSQLQIANRNLSVPMGDGYLLSSLSLTIATVAGVLVQLLFSLLEMKKRR